MKSDVRQDKGWLVNKPFSNWVKLSDVLSNHFKLLYHQESLQAADILRDTIQMPASRIDVVCSSSLQSQMAENSHILCQIVRAVLFLCKQGLSLRGDVENVSTMKNPGNCLALLRMFAETDNILHNHLQQPRTRNAAYISPTTQNEIINIVGYDIIRANSVLADEVSSHAVEHLAICLHFVDEQCDVREEFVSFGKMQRVRAIDISNGIVSSLEGLGLSLNELRGQGYDGASTMSSEKSGVQRLIRNKQPKAIYTQHSLNLAIVSSCSVPAISNCIERVKSLTLWIKSSPKRESILKTIYQRGVQSGTTQSWVPILNVCITHWVEKY